MVLTGSRRVCRCRATLLFWAGRPSWSGHTVNAAAFATLRSRLLGQVAKDHVVLTQGMEFTVVQQCQLFFISVSIRGKICSLPIPSRNAFSSAHQILKNLILEILNLFEIPDLWREEKICASQGWYLYCYDRSEVK